MSVLSTHQHSIPYWQWFFEKNLSDGGTPFLNEGPDFMDEAKLLGHTLVDELLMIRIMRWLFFELSFCFLDGMVQPSGVELG